MKSLNDRVLALEAMVGEKFNPQQIEQLEEAKEYFRDMVKLYGPYATLAVVLLVPEFIEKMKEA